MRSWGVADAATLGHYELLYPDGQVAQAFVDETASCGDLLYNGAEPAADFVSAS